MRNQSYRAIKAILLSACLVACVTACKTGGKQNKDNVLVTSWPSEPSSLHPVCGMPSGTRILIFEYTQKTLTRTDMRTMQQIPVLVKGLAEASGDGTRFSYTLRDDVKWDDGSPLSVDDVVFTMKATKCPVVKDAMVRSVYDNVMDIEKDPADPLKFTMVAKGKKFDNKYIFNELYIIEKKHWDSAGALDKVTIPEMDHFDTSKSAPVMAWAKAFNDGSNGHDVKKLCGLGAYAVSDWTANTSITLTRKANWWGQNDTSAYDKAYLSKIVVKIIPSDEARYLAILNHSLDVDVWLYTDSYLKLKGNADFNANYYSGTTDQFQTNLIFINTKPDGTKHQKLFTDKNVRRAMALLTPVDQMNTMLVKGMATRLASFIYPQQQEYYNNDLKLIPFDIEKAKQLLTGAGWVDSDGDNIRDKTIDGKKVQLSFKLTYSAASPTNKEYMLMIKDAMYKAGVNVEPDPVDQAKLGSKLGDHDFDMVLSAYSSTGVIPDDPEQFLGSKEWGNNGSNLTGFGNAESDTLIAQSNRETDAAKRAVILKQLQAKVYDDQPMIFLYGLKRKVVISKKYANPGMYVPRPGVMLNDLEMK